MKRLLVIGATVGALLGAAALVTPALAEDAPAGTLVPGAQLAQVPPPPMPAMNWSGFYLGVDVGGGWGNDSDHEVSNTSGMTSFFTPSAPASLSGVKAGGYLGFNWQGLGLVLGVEGDGEFSNLSGRTTYPNTGIPADSYKATIESDGSIRGRIGYPVNFGLPFLGNVLPYVTGGLAIGRINEHDQVGATGASTNLSKTLTGWTVGTGLDLAFAPQWIGRIEYRHADFGSFSYTTPLFAAFIENHKNITEDVIRVGLAYRFATPPPPPPAPMAMPAPPPAAPRVFIVFFDWDKDTITAEGRQIIAQAADAYKSGAPVQIQVTGYTDRSGSPGYNQRLSERRANNVAKALAARGVPPAQMVVSGRGENDNRVPTADGVREPQNRRVEIIAP